VFVFIGLSFQLEKQIQGIPEDHLAPFVNPVVRYFAEMPEGFPVILEGAEEYFSVVFFRVWPSADVVIGFFARTIFAFEEAVVYFPVVFGVMAKERRDVIFGLFGYQGYFGGGGSPAYFFESRNALFCFGHG
jgi:hypothetical protein